MDKRNDKLGKYYKTEADDLLFDGLSFDERLKASVRERMDRELSNLSVPSDQSNPADRSDNDLPRRRDRFQVTKRIAAACVVLTLASLPLLHQWLEDSTDHHLIAGEEPGIEGEPPPMITENDVPAPITGEPSTLFGDSESPFALSSAEEAKSGFGDGLLVPENVPEGFELSYIQAYGTPGEDFEKVVFHLDTDSGKVTLSASKAEETPLVGPNEMLDVRGTEGSMWTDSFGTRLQWTEKNIRYSISGALTAEEAIRLAESLK